MKRLSILTVLAAVLLGAAARAETLSFPEAAPVASVTFPDDWDSEETDSGVASTTPDGSISFYLDVADGKSIETVLNDAFTFLGSNGVTVEEASQQARSGEINGMPLQSIIFDGKDEDGPATIQVGFLVTAPDKALVFTYWGTKGDEDAHQGQLETVVASIKPAG
ncbi:hypothetical protein ASG43_16200 [Aureimonas sp. Leaf454]|uniref:hypothetical protein n=1 Tax=Aureimonas sp. Leaf454 TaxID=1736381 RepID=UPI0006F90E79|nr:hypothetical protein [Aureimonas sp. Leaf454]KQT43064.1 hypothetical protein ASG43_16200 [Aureimonas sp. Leaf454]